MCLLLEVDPRVRLVGERESPRFEGDPGGGCRHEASSGDMSVAVALDRLAEQVDALGPRAYFISFGADGKGHVVSVMVRLEGTALEAEVGRTTRANLGANSAATVLWP